MDMHDLQKYILKRLSNSPERQARFSSIKPSGIESNKFNYHLTKLVEKGFVKKKASGHYCLSARGVGLVSSLSFGSFNLRIQPKIVSFLIIKNSKGQYALYRWTKGLNTGQTGFPHGKLHFGENKEQAAKRELFEKTGMKCNLKHAGNVYVRIMQQGVIAQHLLCHVFTGTSKQDLEQTSSFGENFWAHEKDFPKKDFIPGGIEILKIAKKKRSFFSEEIEVKDKWF